VSVALISGRANYAAPVEASGSDPASHYDRVTAAWQLVLGDDLHHGVFAEGTEDLLTATRELTRLMIEASAMSPAMRVLDAGCGTGGPARQLAQDQGVHVLGISTSRVGVETAQAKAAAEGLDDLLAFEQRDALATGLPEESFDVLWMVESSQYLVPREAMMTECLRLLRPGGRLVLCDVVLKRPLELRDLRRLHTELSIMQDVFGDAQMSEVDEYLQLFSDHGLEVSEQIDLTAQVRPTYAVWGERAREARAGVSEVIGEAGWRRFLEGCEVMDRLSGDGVIGYGLLAAAKPAAP
jgi:27-O-demethylrifamycin SV methyltransferase